MKVLTDHDALNWVVILMFTLAYLHTVVGERLERMREDKWADRMREEKP